MSLFILAKIFINPSCEMLVRLTEVNNFGSENAWIRIFVRKCLTQTIAGENQFDFGIRAKSFKVLPPKNTFRAEISGITEKDDAHRRKDCIGILD